MWQSVWLEYIGVIEGQDHFGIYVHVPFCSSRCGYCDFNTYTAGELGDPNSPQRYLAAVEQELERAAARYSLPQADTVFFGGGTPSLLGAQGLSRILDRIRSTVGLSPGAEVTTESNPESTSPSFFEQLRNSGFTRISLGMQSTAPHVLAMLDRRHTPGRALQAAYEASQAGFEHISLDVIYGTPTETEDDLRKTIEDALSTPIDHLSAYSLIIEDGTAMGRKLRKGMIIPTDDDVLAQRYFLIDELVQAAGMSWYEVSNWARPGGECRHNLLYWNNADWWGAGPGAHGKIGSTRFINLKHPSKYADAIESGELPIASTEHLGAEELYEEHLLCGLRLKQGVARDTISQDAHGVVDRYLRAGLLCEPSPGRIALHDDHRLLADGVIADIVVGD